MKAWRHRAGRHVLFWAAVSGFFLLLQLAFEKASGVRFFSWQQYAFTTLPLLLLGTYSLLYGLLPRLRHRQAGGQFVAGLLGWVVAAVLAANWLNALYTFVVAPWLLRQPPGQAFHWADCLRGPPFNFYALLSVAAGAGAVQVYHGWHEQQQLSRQLRLRQLATELHLLKAQLQPTFLFNALATLQTLTVQRPALAPAAVLQLAALLRYTLYESLPDAVPLADEVAMMQHYVALEQLRLGPQVEVSLSFSGALRAHTIAPLLLLPFVENAFRHGTGPQLECPWLSIDLVAKNEYLTFKVLNSQSATGPAWCEGPGLRSLRQRLARLYPGRHELRFVAEPDTFLMILHLWPAPPAPVGLPAPPAATS